MLIHCAVILTPRRVRRTGCGFLSIRGIRLLRNREEKPRTDVGFSSPRTPDDSMVPCHCLRHDRSEEHTSELQSRFDLVCRLLLEKKQTTQSRIEHNGDEHKEPPLSSQSHTVEAT